MNRTSSARTAGKADLEFYYTCPERCRRDETGERVKKVSSYEGSLGTDSLHTWYYVQDAQGNVLAVYEQLVEDEADVWYLREQAIYGSDRLGLWKPDLLVKRVGGITAINPNTNRVIISGVNYDSPATHPDSVGGNESRVGEYVLLWNPSNEIVQLDSMRLENAQNGTSVGFTSEDSLQPYQRMLVHWGVSASDSLFRLVSLIPDTVLDDPALKRLWTTGLELDDTWGDLRLIYEPDTIEYPVDALKYGEAIGLTAENQYFADTLLDSLEIREPLMTLARHSYNSQIGGSVWGGGITVSGTLGGQMQPLPVAYVPNDFEHSKGEKVYEMKNHLGNVLLVVTDLKLGQEVGTADDTTDFYLPEVVAASDYYPFGMPMPGRTWQAGTYRYGFNGKEADGEWNGEGNMVDYGFRVHDARLGRFLSVDPLAPEFPWYTPYQFAGNKPIWASDLDGLEELRYTDEFKKYASELWTIISNSQYLYEIYQSISKPEKRNDALVYIAIKKSPGGSIYFGREQGETYNIGVYVKNIIYLESQQDLSSEDFGRLDSYRAKISNLGLDEEELKLEIEANPDRDIFAVSLTFENTTGPRQRARTIGHEVVAHLQNDLNGIDKKGPEEHGDFTGIGMGSPKWKKFKMQNNYTPNAEEFEEGSPGKILFNEIDRSIDNLPQNEK